MPIGAFRTWVKYIEKGQFPNTRRYFNVLRCNHCDNAPCIRICPVTALFRRPNGIVDFDPEQCIGCKACMQACPYDALYINPYTNTAEKCNFCAHRVEVGLEPACVIVCPVQAIIAGDLDNPDSHISSLLGRQEVHVRKPEQGTLPKLFYIRAEESGITPDACSRPDFFMWSEKMAELNTVAFQEEMEKKARTVYDISHDRPWGWKVSAYLWTKSISSGAFLIPALLSGLGIVSGIFNLEIFGAITGLVFLAITGLLLIFDLKRPERFYRILTRPQWRSWLTIGAYIITGYGLVISLWLAVATMGWGALSDGLSWAGAVLAALTAIYSGFLFGQAEGRDLWQSPVMAVHLLVQALVAGAAVLLVASPAIGMSAQAYSIISKMLVGSLILNIFIILAGEILTPHTSADAKRAIQLITRGPFKMLFWGGAIVAGSLIPILLLLIGQAEGYAIVASLLSLAGLLAFEHVWIMAGQAAPLS